MKELKDFIVDVTKDRMEISTGTILSLTKAKLFTGQVVRFSGEISSPDVGKIAKFLKTKDGFTLLQISGSIPADVKTLYV